jgi:hypothetical protein
MNKFERTEMFAHRIIACTYNIFNTRTGRESDKE